MAQAAPTRARRVRPRRGPGLCCASAPCLPLVPAPCPCRSFFAAETPESMPSKLAKNPGLFLRPSGCSSPLLGGAAFSVSEGSTPPGRNPSSALSASGSVRDIQVGSPFLSKALCQLSARALSALRARSRSLSEALGKLRRVLCRKSSSRGVPICPASRRMR